MQVLGLDTNHSGANARRKSTATRENPDKSRFRSSQGSAQLSSDANRSADVFRQLQHRTRPNDPSADDAKLLDPPVSPTITPIFSIKHITQPRLRLERIFTPDYLSLANACLAISGAERYGVRETGRNLSKGDVNRVFCLLGNLL